MNGELERLRALSEAATPGPWIRRWASLDVQHMSGADALTAQRDIDFAVAACEYVRDLLARDVGAGLDVAELAVLQKALVIGSISHDGDGWYAKDAGYDYDDAEATLLAASAILRRLAAARHPEEPESTT